MGPESDGAKDDPIGWRPGEGRESGVGLAFRAGIQNTQVDTLRAHRFLHLPDDALGGRLVRLHEQGDHPRLRNQLQQQLEMQLYVRDPLEEEWTFEPSNNFRVDFGFWTGETLIAIEIDGSEPSGYARDVRRDRLLRRAEVDVI